MSFKSIRFIIFIALVALIGTLLINGCAKEKIVAKVGELAITADEFKTEFINRYRTEENASKQSYKERLDYLDTMIDKKIKLVDAYRKGLDKNEDVVKAGEDAQERVAVQQVLFQQEIVDKIINDQTIRDYYDKLGEEISARHILIKCNPNDSASVDSAKARIDSVLKVINEGGDFAELAKALSDDKSNAGNGGDLGWFGWGKMVDEFQNAAFALEVGQVSDPVLTPFGWHLIKLEDRRPVDREPYEAMKDKLTEELRRIRWPEVREMAEEYLEDLKVAKGLVYYDSTLAEIYDRVTKSESPKNVSIFSDFNEDDRKIVVAAWSSGEVTVGEMDEKIGNASIDYFKKPDDFKQVIDGVVVPKLLKERAQEFGAFDDPEALKAAKEAREAKMMVDIEKLEVDDKINTDDETLKDFYSANLDKYVTEQQVTIREILVDSKEEAEKLLAQGKSGADFAKLASKNTQRSSAKNKQGLLGPFGPKRYGQLGREAHQLEVGQFCEKPVRMGKNYSVFKVVDKIPATQQTFEDSKRDVERDYKREVTQKLRDDWLAKLKAEIPVKIYEKNLRNVIPFQEVEAPKEEAKPMEKPEMGDKEEATEEPAKTPDTKEVQKVPREH